MTRSDLQATILVASHDTQLADVRKTVLEGAGYLVIPASNLLEIQAACDTSHIKLAIVGHSLPPKERRRVGLEIRQVCGVSTPILELHDGEGPTLADLAATKGHLSQEGDDFLEKVRELLRG